MTNDAHFIKTQIFKKKEKILALQGQLLNLEKELDRFYFMRLKNYHKEKK